MIDLWHLANINWLSELPAATLERLRAAATVFTVDRGDMIFEPMLDPEFVFLLETGLVRIFRRSAEGGEITLGFVHPGEVFGELTVFSDKPRESYALAAERSTVIKVARKVFADAIHQRASVVFSVAAQMGERFKEIESRAEDLVFRSARARLAKVLNDLVEEFGQQASGRHVIGARLTHAELATLAGTSRPTVSIMLADFEEEGLIRREDGRIVVVDKAALQREADA